VTNLHHPTRQPSLLERRELVLALRRAFATMVSSSAAPYGYTLTVWSSGALLIHFRHAPTVWEVFLFLFGAVVAFAALWLFGRGPIEESDPVSQHRHARWRAPSIYSRSAPPSGLPRSWR
jgi:hypothetical protein